MTLLENDKIPKVVHKKNLSNIFTSACEILVNDYSFRIVASNLLHPEHLKSNFVFIKLTLEHVKRLRLRNSVLPAM